MVDQIDRIREEMGTPPIISGAYRGVLFALGTAVAIFLLVYVDASIAGEVDVLQNSDSENSLGYVVGWTIYAAHMVPIDGTTTTGFVGFFDGVPEYVYYLLPPLLLVFAGRVVARANGHADMSSVTLGASGAFVVLGYLPVMVAGAFVLENGGIAPALPETVLIAGLVYPLLFGFIGGYTAKY